jgi:protein-disulfide isomerase
MNRTHHIVLDGVTLVTAACAVLLTVHAFRASAGIAGGRATEDRSLDAAMSAKLLSSGHRIGPKNARLTLVEFGDFQCPVCGAYEHELDSMRVRHPDEFAIVFHQFPLSYHPLAYPLARASECAAAQGRFTAFHDSVYKHQASLGIIPIVDLGARAGVPDTARFRSCALATTPVPEIERDIKFGQAIQIPGTPAVIVQGVLLARHPDLEQLETLLQRTATATAGGG